MSIIDKAVQFFKSSNQMNMKVIFASMNTTSKRRKEDIA